jgi:CheY-like chemotaxis protein
VDPHQPGPVPAGEPEPVAPGNGVYSEIRRELLEVASMLEPDHSPAAVPGVAAAGADQLRNKYVGLLNFEAAKGVELRAALESRGATAVALVPLATNLTLICQILDLLIWAVPAASSLPAVEQLDELRSYLKPMLWVGPRQHVAPLTFWRPGTWDYLETPYPLEPVLWRAGMLLALNRKTSGSTVRQRRAVSRTVLVLDDNPISRGLVERTLASTGFSPLQPPEEMPVLDFIREHRPAVVVTELNTVTEEAFELLQAIRQELALASTRVVVLSAQRGETEVLRAFGLGADDYVTKPFSPLELAARVARLVELR